jgi:endogenous inhibitor of DNA gyrase (YacG/DUF329 family)
MAREPVCTICGKPQTAKFKPFCSGRCADIDLNRWLKGSYAIPGKALDEEEDGEHAPPGGDGEG